MTKRHIIFDIGGVLVEWEPHLAWSDDLGQDGARDFIARTNFMALNSRADGGERFDQLAAEVPNADDRDLFSEYVSRYIRTVPNAIMGTWDLLDQLMAAGHGIHAITNWSAETWPEGIKVHPRLDQVFETLVVSGREGVKKPDAAIFELLCERADITAHDCLFIDDGAHNVAGAKAVGMDAVQFIDSATLENDFKVRGLL
ncbi:HAD family hydrolase [Pseudaestuariivita rosea]|uniref:HAD family hydrolase n=1 Tax=Pseudaestuariivita rosea TaxID=2763263 RepID=UPI001ABAFC24|nr:HAD family phosphatase [Pseudaestuariivita rosea]